MPKTAKELSAIEIKRMNTPGFHMVGTVAGLGIRIKDTGAKSWILRCLVGTRRTDIGLGGYPEITLAKAHERARELKEKIRQGINPLAEKRALKLHIEWTFENCAETYIKLHAPSWTNDKHAAQWTSTLKNYTYPKIGAIHVKDIGVKEVLSVIEAQWSTKTETMNRLRNRIERILDWAKVRGYRDGDNPAIWRGNLDQALPKPSKVSKVESHKGVPIDEMYVFLQSLKAQTGMGARCLEMVIYTACRSGEARGALWSEIDLNNRVWKIPAARMKSDREHRIPLNDACIQLLKAIPIMADAHLVFPSASNVVLSDMTLTAVMRRMKQPYVPHGFRSTFATWAQERTNHPSDVRERALAHSVGNKTTEAYERGDQFEKRKRLMSDWNQFISMSPDAINIIKFKKSK